MHAVALPGGRFVVLREMLKEPWRTHAVELLTREAQVLELLAATPVPAPGLVAVEPPWLAMTLLPGALRLDAEAPEALARTLLAIHAIDPPQPPRGYYHWAYPERRRVPDWASDAAVWEWAFAAIDRPAPDFEPCFLHRDFHPGNVLFTGADVTGVVDWVETSWGPADLDVAHCGPRWRCCTGARRRRRSGSDRPPRARAAAPARSGSGRRRGRPGPTTSPPSRPRPSRRHR